MSKRRSTQSGSLDLLLDTICNTFGGILLISLLVIILLNTTSKTKSSSPPSLESQAKMLENEIEREKLTRELETLNQAVENQRKNAAELVSDEAIQLSKDLVRLKEENTKNVLEKSELMGVSHEIQIALNEVASDIRASSDEIAKAEMKLSKLKSGLDENVEKHSSKITIPKVQDTKLSPITFFLKDGKIYGPVDALNGDENTEEFRFIKENGQIMIEARQEAGTVVPDESADLTAIDAKFSIISSRTHYVQLFIWPDTFGRFDPILVTTDARNLKREIHLMAEGSIVVRTHDTLPRRVQ